MENLTQYSAGQRVKFTALIGAVGRKEAKEVEGEIIAARTATEDAQRLTVYCTTEDGNIRLFVYNDEPTLKLIS